MWFFETAAINPQTINININFKHKISTFELFTLKHAISKLKVAHRFEQILTNIEVTEQYLYVYDMDFSFKQDLLLSIEKVFVAIALKFPMLFRANNFINGETISGYSPASLKLFVAAGPEVNPCWCRI